jgi:hypothetical protein
MKKRVIERDPVLIARLQSDQLHSFPIVVGRNGPHGRVIVAADRNREIIFRIPGHMLVQKRLQQVGLVILAVGGGFVGRPE